MAYTDWNTNASLNVTIDGVNIDENCPPGGINNAIRSIMAGVASLNTDLPDTSTLMPKAGGTFSGAQPKYNGRGAYLHHNAAANASGRVYILADGTSNPSSPANGDIVFFYTP